MNMIKEEEAISVISMEIESMEALHNDEDQKDSFTANFFQQVCDLPFQEQMAKDPNERDEEFIAFLSATTLPEIKMNEMEDKYQARACHMINEVGIKPIDIWNPLSLLTDPGIEQVRDASTIMGELRFLSRTDPDQCQNLLNVVEGFAHEMKSRLPQFPRSSTRTGQLTLFYQCLFQMKDIVRIMKEVRRC